MCGIVGVCAARPVSDRNLVTVMRDTMHHRGPDDAGVWWSRDGQVGLGHRRLSILDLSPAGRQPMTDRTGELQIVFNGEIYNYRPLRDELIAAGATFDTGTDTEVILQAYRRWGDDCLTRLQGMFALAIYDEPKRRLLLARDRIGEKPLYLRAADGALWFASELKALLADRSVARVIDGSALEHYLSYAFVDGTQSIIRGVEKLPPAHALVWSQDQGVVRRWCYWTPRIEAPEAGDAAELTTELENLLGTAVRRCLQADVPVGVLLSGGLDSSVVAALAAKGSGRALKTFTVTFPGHGGFDESIPARQVAHHLGTTHHELPAGEIHPRSLERLSQRLDEPLGDSSLLPSMLLAELVRGHVTVAIGGDGGDELFGGYRHYNWMPGLTRWRRRMPALVGASVAGAGRWLPVGTRGRHYLQALGGAPGGPIGHVDLYFDRHTRARLRGTSVHTGTLPELAKEAAGSGPLLPTRRAMVSDLRRYLPEDVLVKVDRTSMLASLEVRSPLLDHHVAEFALAAVPDRLLATGSDRKILLRALGQRLLPAGFDLRRKQGFSVPLTTWLRGEWGGFTEQVLTDPGQTVFDHGVIRNLIDGQRRGRDNAKRIFALTAFELWRRNYAATVES